MDYILEIVQLLFPFLIAVVFSTIHIIRVKPKTPIELLAEIASKAAKSSWKKMMERTDVKISPEFLPLINKSINYLNKKEDSLSQIEYRRPLPESPPKEDTRSEKQKEFDHLVEGMVSSVLIAVAIVVAGYLLIGFILSIPKIISFLAQNVLEISFVVLFFSCIAFILSKIETRDRDDGGLVPIVGNASGWPDRRFLSLESVRSDRNKLYVVMNQMGKESDYGDISSSQSSLLEEPPSDDEPPLAPGISELALAMQGEAIGAIRDNLKRIRNFHHRLAIATVISFFVSVAFGFYATVYLQSDVYKMAFGGTGLGAILAAFAFFTLRNERIAQISLALFESYVAELHLSLTEAESTSDQKEKVALRNIAWQQFRLGLNGLWEKERKLNGK